jgi:hypothetical protein
MEMYKDEPYTENFGLGAVTGAVSSVAGGDGITDLIVAAVEPVFTAIFSVFGKLLGKWWLTVQYFFLYMFFVTALVYILILVFRLEFGAGRAASAMAMVKGV